MPSKPAFFAMANFSSREAPALIMPGMMDFLGFSARGAPTIASAFARAITLIEVARNSRRFIGPPVEKVTRMFSPLLFQELDEVGQLLRVDDLLEAFGHERQGRAHHLLDADLQDRVVFPALPLQRHARRRLRG